MLLMSTLSFKNLNQVLFWLGDISHVMIAIFYYSITLKISPAQVSKQFFFVISAFKRRANAKKTKKYISCTSASLKPTSKPSMDELYFKSFLFFLYIPL
jgi:hypothetical protein